MTKKINQEASSRRIKYAFYLEGWSYETGNKDALKNNGTLVIPSEYIREMDGSLFCPVCCTNLIRVPKDKDYFSNGRDACFSHISTYTNIKCDLRSTKSQGKSYKSYEEAKKAIEDENLVIVSEFIKDRPELPEYNESEYDETPIEDQNGRVLDVPISRHNGKSFKLPSRRITVAGICRKFDNNMYKYYSFPGQKNAKILLDNLKNIESVENEDDIPRLYYGIIKRSYTFVPNPKPTNIRMTELKCHKNICDFYIKDKDGVSKQKGITDNSQECIVIAYGKVTENGRGLCIENLGWGEYALLPAKYNSLLISKSMKCVSFSENS